MNIGCFDYKKAFPDRQFIFSENCLIFSGFGTGSLKMKAEKPEAPGVGSTKQNQGSGEPWLRLIAFDTVLFFYSAIFRAVSQASLSCGSLRSPN